MRPPVKALSRLTCAGDGRLRQSLVEIAGCCTRASDPPIHDVHRVLSEVAGLQRTDAIYTNNDSPAHAADPTHLHTATYLRVSTRRERFLGGLHEKYPDHPHHVIAMCLYSRSAPCHGSEDPCLWRAA